MRGRIYTLRSRPGDFSVEEIVDFEPREDGGYGIYKLAKEGLDTYSALKIVARRTGIPLKAIGYAGLKDRYSRSVQYISIPRKAGGRLDFEERNMSLSFVCNSARPLRIGIHRGNAFNITVRRMSKDTLDFWRTSVSEMAGLMMPNYFDSQRFGSIRGGREFFAVPLLKGDYEGALKLILTSTYRKEKSPVKALKRHLAENWGNWPACLRRLSGGLKYENYIEIFSYLNENPNDFKGALKIVRQYILKIGISAFQSYIWNETVKQQLVSGLGMENLTPVRYEAGELLFPRLTREALDRYREYLVKMGGESIPMPHYKVREGDRYYQAFKGKVEPMGVELRRFKKLEDFGISLVRGERRMFFEAKDLKITNEGFQEDITAPRRYHANFSFSLQPGSYATIVIKGLLG